MTTNTYYAGPFFKLSLAYFVGFGSLITFLVLSSGVPALAEWVVIDSSMSSHGLTVYADPDTIRRKGNLAMMWMLIDFHPIQEARKPFWSSKTQLQYDCEEERSRTLAYTVFSGNMGNGEVLVTNSDESTWKPVVPGSRDEAFWRLACGKQ